VDLNFELGKNKF